MQLFYGVQAPLFILALYPLYLLREVRLFQLPDLAPTSLLIVSTVTICILAFCLETLSGYASCRRWLAWVQVLVHSLLPGVGIYLGLLLLFYALPFAIDFARYFFVLPLQILGEGLLLDPATSIWLLPIFFLLFVLGVVLTIAFSTVVFCFTAGPILAMPFALAGFYWRSGCRVLRSFAAQYGRIRMGQGAIAVTSTWIILCIAFSLQPQPQLKAFQLLDRPATTPEIRQEQLAASDKIQAGLVNAYLSSYRYLSFKDENNNIRAKYKKLGLPEGICQFLQNSYNHLMSPFLYHGSRADIQKAETLYSQFFDAPIQKAERETIQLAVQTPEDDDVKAGLLNIDREKIWLVEQQVTVDPQTDWAEVELYEVYANEGEQVEEIVYSFSLPESAVITGLWLGNSNERDQRFAPQISPRGAAQKTYTSQVRREEPVDPALLEQVGPRNYRLRVFPIFPRSPLHLWLTYHVMQQDQGWPLPQLVEKRNIFWTEDSQRRFNGEGRRLSPEIWLPEFIPAEQPHQPRVHQASLSNGYRISAKPLNKTDYAWPKNQRFAVVLDGSRSMSNRVDRIVATLNDLKAKGFADGRLENNDADLYLTVAPGMSPQRIDDIRQFDPKEALFYGTLQPSEMLQQFAKLQGNTQYDGILLITDEGSYELAEKVTATARVTRRNRSGRMPDLSAPLWLVHLGSLPNAYDDVTLQAIHSSGGGIAAGIQEALQRQATKMNLGEQAIGVLDGYGWFVKEPGKLIERNKNAQNEAETMEKEFSPLAARQLIRWLSGRGGLEQLAELDFVHAIAKEHQIVSPYSSAIVLVNEQQQQLLKQAEANADRFDRNIEDGNEPLGQHTLSVSEPGAIIGLVVIAFILILKRKRRPRSRRLQTAKFLEAGQ